MKKSLSLLVAIAMVFSMFATVVSAADEKTAGEYLNELGVILGNQDGDLKEDQTWKRQDVAVLLSRLLGVEEDAKNADNTHGFTDVTDANYNGYISWAVEEGLFEGKGDGKFGFGAELKNQEFYALVLRVFGEETSGENYANVPELAVEFGFADEDTDFAAIPTRGATYETIVTALKTPVGENGETLEVLLGLVTVTELAVNKVEQTDAREITVFFNKEVTDEQKTDLTYTVKSGAVPYTVTATYADDKKSAVLKANYLPAGEYEVTVKGFDAKTLTVAAEVPTKIEIGANALQRTAGQDVQAKLLNQFGKAVANPSLNISVYNASKGVAVSAVDGKYDLTGGTNTSTTPHKPNFDVDDTVVVTVTHSSGLSLSKSFKLVAGSAATSIKIGTIQPLKDKTRISAGDAGLVVPIELVDQYGANIKLAEIAKTPVAAGATNFTFAGITFTLSQAGVVSHYAVDKDGVFTIDVATAATLVIHAINPATGASGSTTAKIEGAPVLKTISLERPAQLVTANEEIKIAFNAVDNFNDALKAKDIKINLSGTFVQNEVQFNASVPFAAGYPKINAKGELLFKFQAVTAKTNAIVTAFVNGQQAGQLTLEINQESTKVKVNGLKSVLTTLVNGASVEFDKDNVTYVDNYGRTANVGKVLNAAATPATGDVVLTVVEGTSATITSDVSNNVTHIAASATVTGVTKFKAELAGIANSAYEFTVNVVKVEDVKSYTVKSLGTIYGGKIGGVALTEASAHAKAVEVVGKIGSTDVALVQATAFDFVTVEGTNASVAKHADGKFKVFGLAEGTATVNVYKNGEKLADTTVTVSTVNPVATTVEFDKSEYTLSLVGIDEATVTVTVKDQYGVALTVGGLLSSSDNAIVSIDGSDIVAEAKGTVTLRYITANNVVGTAVVVVED